MSSPAEFSAGEPAPLTIRVPPFFSYDDAAGDRGRGSIVVQRGEMLTEESAASARALIEGRFVGAAALIGYFALALALALVYAAHLRRARRLRPLRAQAILLLALLGLATAVQGALLFSPVSNLLVPIAAVAILAVVVSGRASGVATALVGALLVGMLGPFDPGVVAVLAAQGVAAVAVLRPRETCMWRILTAGAAAGAAAAAGYAGVSFLAYGELPTAELAAPLRSAWLAAAAGGFLAAPLALLARPLAQRLAGDATPAKLAALGDLSHPLLEQLATKAPGSWQHSLAMANMAEVAARAVGADGRLVRVGAYYHDIGKAVQPEYYVENMSPGAGSPHDSLPPEDSRDAIVSHVTEGVRLGRKYNLPEAVIDFIHMHHGDGVLEYFWDRCQSQGNPRGLRADDFRYPGRRPQTRETAILAICDAVEAASRTLKNPDERAIRNLVQHIIYGKLRLGQLDDAELGPADLRRISDSLIGQLRHAHHGRIEYPWQEEERRAENGGDRESHAPATQGGAPPPGATAEDAAASFDGDGDALTASPRLDSLDHAHPIRRELKKQPSLGTADTERVSSSSGAAKATVDQEPTPTARPAKRPPAPPPPEPDEAPADVAHAQTSQTEHDGEVRVSARASTSDEDELSPGTMVLGPPPKSRTTGSYPRSHAEDDPGDLGKRRGRR